jgi:hypothetical protein
MAPEPVKARLMRMPSMVITTSSSIRVNPEVAEFEKIRRWEGYIHPKIICKNWDARARNALLK